MEKKTFKDELYEILVTDKKRIIRIFIMILILIIVLVIFKRGSESGSFIYEQF